MPLLFFHTLLACKIKTKTFSVIHSCQSDRVIMPLIYHPFKNNSLTITTLIMQMSL